ncbi:uncharacterized protein LOC113271920 [Papaver somniferum]|uniref:uncharacterized protein LOC113271920 n=1 Tax=Papaver somniferum TaxID=3469 RepID=UPI000E6F8082|nr:uncharacterized protein LOC113271920 [Papaver somniferum]
MTALRIGCGPKLRKGNWNIKHYKLSSAKDLGSSLAYQRSKFLDICRFTGLGSSPADTGRRLSYLWRSAKDLGSSLADRRSKFLDLRSRFTGLGSIPIDNRHAATPFIPLDQRQRPQDLLFGPAELLYISRDQLNIPQNDCKSPILDNKGGTWVTGTNVWDRIPRSPVS